MRPIAGALLMAAVAAPVVRRRLKLPPAAVLSVSACGPLAASVLIPRGRARDTAVCALNMWVYVAAYEMPHDDPERLAARVRVRYPILADRILGLGTPPTLRLQRTFADPQHISRFERTLVWCHWLWFLVPHGTVAYVLLRRREMFPRAAARMYAVFDVGAIFYWAIPTAPPWWAAARGHLEDGNPLQVRRMMIEYGEQFWGDRWTLLYDVLGGNPLAAMPSLHFATSLMAARILTEVGPVEAAVGWTYATLLGIALVYLGEHYAIDLVGGAALEETVRRAAPRATPLARALTRVVSSLGAVARPA